MQDGLRSFSSFQSHSSRQPERTLQISLRQHLRGVIAQSRLKESRPRDVAALITGARFPFQKIVLSSPPFEHVSSLWITNPESPDFAHRRRWRTVAFARRSGLVYRTRIELGPGTPTVVEKLHCMWRETRARKGDGE